METPNPVGRPPHFKSAEEMQRLIDAYFIWVKGESHLENEEIYDEKSGKWKTIKVKVWDREEEPITITGLALFLDFESRQSFYEYEKKPEFTYTIKKARLRVENSYEKRLDGNSVTGPIFALKNLGWDEGKKAEDERIVVEVVRKKKPVRSDEDSD